MKHLGAILILLLTQINSYAQNLVPNGNFETYSVCPTALTQITNCTGWRAYHLGTSDFFHSCGTGNAAIPINVVGIESPISGNAYTGLLTYTTGVSLNNYKEYVCTNTTPLTIGGRYEVSMSVSLADNSGYGTNDLGVWFYDVGPSTTLSSSFLVLPVTPQISYSSYGAITTTNGWQRLSAKFTADSSYDNVVIGGFNSYTSQTRTLVSSISSNSYYYIDSVVVQLDNAIGINFPDTLLCAGDTFYVPYTTKSGIVFNSSNIFTVQLSNTIGSFNSPLAIGSTNSTTAGSIKCVIPTTIIPGIGYRIRIYSSNVIDSSVNNGKNITIGVVKPAKPLASSNSPKCSGDTISLNINSPTVGASYTWIGPGFSSSQQNPSIPNTTTSVSGQYIVTVQLLGCFNKDTTNVLVNQMPLPITANVITPICEPDTLKFTSTNSTSGSNYSWIGPASFSSILQNPNRTNSTTSMSGDYIVTASLGTFCVQKDTVNVLVKPLPANRQLTSNSPICSGNNLLMEASSSSASTTYLWIWPSGFSSNTSKLTFNNAIQSLSGKYIIIYELNGCSVKDSTNITVNESPSPINASVNSPVCEPQVIHLTSTNSNIGAKYNWSGPNGFSSTNQNTNRINSDTAMSGVYIVTVSLANGCYQKDTINVLVNQSPKDLIVHSNTPICINDTLILSAKNKSSNVIYTWNGPDNFNSSDSLTLVYNFAKNKEGKYKLQAAIGDCKLNVELNTELLDPKLELGENTILCNGETKLLNPDIQSATYLWQDGSNNTSFTIANAGIYWVDATTQCGTLKDSIRVDYQLCDCHPFVPSAFTPNNDGINDKVGPIIDCKISSYKFMIVNRFGLAVFESNDPIQKWDGTYKEQLQDVGTYFYQLQIKGPLNKDYLFKGDIILLH